MKILNFGIDTLKICPSKVVMMILSVMILSVMSGLQMAKN